MSDLGNGTYGRIEVDIESWKSDYEASAYLVPGLGGTGQSGPIEDLSVAVDQIDDEDSLYDALERARFEVGKLQERWAAIEVMRQTGDPAYEEASSVWANDANMLQEAHGIIQNSIGNRLERAAIRLKHPTAALIVDQIEGMKEDFWLDRLTGFLGGINKKAKRLQTLRRGATRVSKLSKRLRYVGRTPGKNSKTGKSVIERLKNKNPPEVREGPNGMEFKDPNDGKWYSIKEADMAHYPRNAVDYWNNEGIKYGAKSPQVRAWMRDSNNYRLEHYSYNRSAGARLSIYNDPP